ncbi:hypothetical protein [Maribacter sp. ACAM166]|nr:hypothetical protein [Maribacter sp. ACAM166]
MLLGLSKKLEEIDYPANMEMENSVIDKVKSFVNFEKVKISVLQEVK